MSFFGKYGPRHCIAHLFGWNCGNPISKFDNQGRLWTAFQCGTCGKIEGAVPASETLCPVCGYYCSGKGGIGCIDKPSLISEPPHNTEDG